MFQDIQRMLRCLTAILWTLLHVSHAKSTPIIIDPAQNCEKLNLDVSKLQFRRVPIGDDKQLHGFVIPQLLEYEINDGVDIAFYKRLISKEISCTLLMDFEGANDRNFETFSSYQLLAVDNKRNSFHFEIRQQTALNKDFFQNFQNTQEFYDEQFYFDQFIVFVQDSGSGKQNFRFDGLVQTAVLYVYTADSFEKCQASASMTAQLGRTLKGPIPKVTYKLDVSSTVSNGIRGRFDLDVSSGNYNLQAYEISFEDNGFGPNLVTRICNNLGKPSLVLFEAFGFKFYERRTLSEGAYPGTTRYRGIKNWSQNIQRAL